MSRVDRRQFTAMLASVGLTADGPAFAAAQFVKPEILQLSANSWVPNNEHQPVLLYRGAIPVSGPDPAARFEQAFQQNGWPAQWRNGRVAEVAENGLLLAASDAATYTERTVPLEPGDRLMLYTDGLVEARDGNGRLFGEDALASALRNSGQLPLDDAAAAIIAVVEQWSQSQDEDLTVLLCDYKGSEKSGMS
jgi:hypothetical protein